MTRHVAILLTNNDSSPFSLRFPDDGAKVASQWGLTRPGWDCEVWSVKDDEFPTPKDADAFIITGSPASVHDSWPWIRRLTRLVQEMHQARVPLVGLCFGHQIIANALGGRVEASATGWRFGAVETEFSLARHWMNPARKRLRLFTSHSEQVTRLPEGATLLGTATNCPNASYCIGSHILTTQYHPEFGRDFMKALALEYRGEVSDDVLERGGAELDLPTDGPIYFEWAAKFVEWSLADRALRAP